MSELFRQQIADLQRRVIALEERAANQDAEASRVLAKIEELTPAQSAAAELRKLRATRV